jgi:hypothetical protein
MFKAPFANLLPHTHPKFPPPSQYDRQAFAFLSVSIFHKLWVFFFPILPLLLFFSHLPQFIFVFILNNLQPQFFKIFWIPHNRCFLFWFVCYITRHLRASIVYPLLKPYSKSKTRLAVPQVLHLWCQGRQRTQGVVQRRDHGHK